MTPDEILTTLDDLRWFKNGEVGAAAAALIRQLQDELAMLRKPMIYMPLDGGPPRPVETEVETIHDRDAREALNCDALPVFPDLQGRDIESLSNEEFVRAQTEALARSVFAVADAMAAERARRAKEAK